MSATITKDHMAISVRIKDVHLAARLTEIAVEHNLSHNMAVQMLLGFAFNEIDKQGKKFESKVVFEAK